MSIYFNIFISLVLILSFGCAHKSKELKINATQAKMALSESQFHNGGAPFGSYLTLDLNYTEYQKIYLELKKTYPHLKTRGEAHITVLTPVEYHQILSDKLSIQEIYQLANELNIQKASFEVLCLGQGRKEIKGKTESTFYLVIKSKDLLDLRKKILDLYLNKGGEKSFEPTKYYPHITIGFTLRDLHESDGVIKNTNSCVRDIVLE